MFTFGPIPSRRLGSSLGVNHIPAKFCSYACVYCQAGPTTRLSCKRREFYQPDAIISDLEHCLADLAKRQVHVDYISFVPDGEPTLDIHLGELLIRSRSFGLPRAVFTNSTLLSDSCVRSELDHADLVSVKVDSIDRHQWRKIDRPYARLDLGETLEGLHLFAKSYSGRLITETMLVQGINDSLPDLAATAEFIASLQPAASYLAVPTRPPMETWVLPPNQAFLSQALAVFRTIIPSQVELLIQGDPAKFASASLACESILAITKVHPMRRVAVLEMLAEAGESETTLNRLIGRGLLQPVSYQGELYYRHSPVLDKKKFPTDG